MNLFDDRVTAVIGFCGQVGSGESVNTAWWRS